MPVSVADTVRFLAERGARDQAAVRRRAVEVRQRLPAVVALLRRDFGAVSVCLFGSHARGQLHRDSDVDLLVAGISSTRIDAAHAAVAALLEGAVDLVRAEDAAPGLLERVRSEGIEL